MPAMPCSTDPDLFFAQSPADVERAKGVCLTCDVRSDCLAAARQRYEPWGVWGGELLVNGAVVPRKLAPGRPRKSQADVA